MNRRLLVVGSCFVFVAVGVIAPIVLGRDQAEAWFVQALHAVAALGFIIGLIGLFQFTGETVAPGEPVYATPHPAPRVLDSDLLGDDADRVPLAARIDAARAASARFSRSIGLLYYNLDSYRSIARADGAPAAEAAMEFVVAMLRMRLRNTDRIERLGKGRFVVCLVLLPERQALLSIGERLESAMRDLRLESLGDSAIEFDRGLSISPMHGYAGEDLLEHAQRDCDAARAQRLRAEARKRKLAAADRSAA